MREATFGGLRSLVVGDDDAELVVVILHGRAMEAADLAPFGSSLGGAARYIFPDAPVALEPRGRSWWPVDPERRAQLRANGPMDLYEVKQPGRENARAMLDALVREVAPAPRRFALVGFSQGGMLAMDYVLHGGLRPSAMALLSSTRIAFDEWKPRLSALADLPVLVTHGDKDMELSFSAGEGLRDAAIAGGARVTWLPFEGPHEIPLVVWRALRNLLRGL
jgi:phospholipase/carboxylesterase